MTAINPVSARIAAAAAQGRTALIPFLPAGFPDKDRFWKELHDLDALGADVIEIGIPFSDPVADGPVVERASLHCLGQCVTLAWILKELAARTGDLAAALVLMGYYNPILQYGLDRFAADAATAGVGGVIVPDLPLEESAPLREKLDAAGVALIPLVGLNTSPERMAAYAAFNPPFAYMVSVMGTTGRRDTLPPELVEKLDQAARAFSCPIALGFGIRATSQLAPFAGRIQAVVIGSALISHIENGGTAASFLEEFKTS